MGRYYKNPDPDFVKPEEFLFKPPWEEIKAGLKFMDQTIKETEQKQDEFSTVLQNVKYNTESDVDKALYENVYGQYKSALEEVQNSTVSNPNDWRSQVTKMRRLSNNLKEDLSKGTLAKIQERKQALDAFDANYKTTLDPTVFNKAREHYLNEVNKELSAGNYDAQFSKEAVMNKRDLNKEFMEYLKQKLDLPNESSINGYGENGQFMYTKNGSTRSVSRKEIENMYQNFLNADAKPYLEYMTKIGVGNYIKDGQVNMDDRELKSGMEFMGGYNYNQTKSNVDAKYSLSAETQAANARAQFEHNLRMKEKEAEIKMQVVTEAAAAAANLSREPQYNIQNSPEKDLAVSVGSEVINNIRNNTSLTPQAKEKAVDAYITAVLNQGGLNKNIIKGKSPEEIHVILKKVYDKLGSSGMRGVVNRFSDHISTIPSLKGLASTAANVRNRVELNLTPHLQLSLTNTAKLVGDDPDVVKRYQDETRAIYKSAGDLMDKKVKVVKATKGNEKNLKGSGVIKEGLLGEIFKEKNKNGKVDSVKSDEFGGTLDSKNNLNIEAGFWMANGKYPAGDPRNVSWAIPGKINGESVLYLVENGPEGIPYGAIK